MILRQLVKHASHTGLVNSSAYFKMREHSYKLGLYVEDQGASHCMKTNAETVRCLAMNAMEIVPNLCKRFTCELTARNFVFGDLCGKVYKYLHVKYECI
ncbi:hypothetical protein DPMN_007471 [Dreissena polymorpha]|uniref:SUEL-type lectin domain-containing protein n=1 Tax=Dreissena polymorpha TaxID=45954 RepID=A0A9D4RYE5_DREPO|nr:hypothetical protein DPMN_007471 [Dreissena polymorpha]